MKYRETYEFRVAWIWVFRTKYKRRSFPYRWTETYIQKERIDMELQNAIIEFSEEQLEQFRQYLYEREHAEATIRKYITDIKTLLMYLGKDTTINKGRLLEYKNWLLSRYAVSSVNSMLAALNQFLEFQGAACFKIKRVKVQKNLFLQEERELTTQEFQMLVHAANLEGKGWLALCMETMAATGIRISELEFFTVERVKKGRIEIYNKGKYRRIFLSVAIQAKLLDFSGKKKILKGPIFVTKEGKPLNRSRIWREMKQLTEKTGIESRKIFPHNLRHLFARVYYQSTGDITGLADLLGHSNINVTRIYTSNTGEIYQEQLNQMNIFKDAVT